MRQEPPFESNACAALDDEQREKIQSAAVRLCDARGLTIKITEIVGEAISRAGGSAVDFLKDKTGIDLEERSRDVIEAALWQAQNASMFGMEPDAGEDRWSWLNKVIATALGAGAGFVGAPGLLVDLPVTTGLIMRSVADIARSYPGEDLNSDETKRACIEVFAFGGPEMEDDEIEFAYWSIRSGLSHQAIRPLIKAVASAFGARMTNKMLAQIVPVAGAAAGAALNYIFIDYYQEIARVHFTIRDVERSSSDPEAVRACFSESVRRVRERRKLGSKKQ